MFHTDTVYCGGGPQILNEKVKFSRKRGEEISYSSYKKVNYLTLHTITREVSGCFPPLIIIYTMQNNMMVNVTI